MARHTKTNKPGGTVRRRIFLHEALENAAAKKPSGKAVKSSAKKDSEPDLFSQTNKKEKVSIVKKSAEKKNPAKTPDTVFLDNKKGSSELVLELNDIFKSNLKKKDYIEETIKEGKKKLKAFAAVQSYLAQAERELKKGSMSFAEFVHNYERDYADASGKIFRKGKTYFSTATIILTISNSGAVFNFLKMLSKEKKGLKVVVCESRPVFEGRLMAKKLLKEGVEVELITEAMLPAYIQKCDAVLTGADVLLKNGHVVNKTGTRAAAIIAKYFNKPFYVVAERTKLSKGISYEKGEHSPDEVWNHKDKKLKVPNYYFEEVREDLITKIITD
jgi:translation initiation factor 2B subunit (eIF-2B alpha/beta/delta family)